MSIVKINPYLFLLTGVILWSTCKLKETEKSLDTEIHVKDAFLRLIGQPNSVIHQKLDSVLNIDNEFTNLISNYILGHHDSISKVNQFEAYFSDTSRARLRDSCDEVFKNLNWNHILGAPFSRYHSAFPDRKIPDIYLLITDFNYGIFVFQDDHNQDALGIGVEMYLDNSVWYDQLSLNNPNFSSYLNRTFNLKHLPSKIIQALISDLMPPSTSNRLLDQIIQEGKKLYITKQLMPGIQDTILHEYTDAQWQWVQQNEWDIWRFLLADKLLYRSSGKDIINLVQPAPHSQGMPIEAPGRAVNFVGMKIIESFVKKEKLSLNELIQQQNAEAILQKARYKPR